MNDREIRNLRENWNRGIVCLVMLAFVATMIGTPLAASAAEDESNKTEEALLGLGSGLLTIVYLPAKVVYAALGGIVGGFAYALTGGDMETAKSVWEPSFYGTYVITPSHLKGEEPVRFFGVSPYEDETL